MAIHIYVWLYIYMYGHTYIRMALHTYTYIYNIFLKSLVTSMSNNHFKFSVLCTSVILALL